TCNTRSSEICPPWRRTDLRRRGKDGAMATIATINPATGQTEKTFEALSEREIDSRLARAAAAFGSYRLTSFPQAARGVAGPAALRDAGAGDVAVIMTTERGKPVGAASAEAQKCARACRFYAEHAEGFLADKPADAGAVGATRAFTRYQPLGPVLAV